MRAILAILEQKKRILSLIIVLSMIMSVTLVFSSKAEAVTTPTIKEVKLISSNMIEIDWNGFDYIKGAGRSKENMGANDRHFEVKLNNGSTATTLALSADVTATPTGGNAGGPSWYWCIKNLSLHGVRVNQNKTTLRLATPLTATQMTAVQKGASTLTMQITGDVVAYDLNVTSTGTTAISASSIGTVRSAPADKTTVHKVKYKPYYDKTVTSKTGIIIRGSEFVHLSTIQKAADMVDIILSSVTPTHLANINSRVSFAIYGPGEHSYNILEHRNIFTRDNWNRAEGYGGTLSSTTAANIERHHNIPPRQRPYESTYVSGYRDQSLLAHEFGHGVHNPGMTTELSLEVTSIYNASIATLENQNEPNGRKKWQGPTAGSFTYMSGNVNEFMSTVTTIWFDAMENSTSWGSIYGMVNTREQLRQYDTPFYNFISRMYPEQKTLSEAWASNVPSTGKPVYQAETAEPIGTYGASVKIKNTSANNPAGSGLCVYTEFNADANTNDTKKVELWWDVNTDLMRWYLDPVDSENVWFRIKKKVTREHTLNQQNENLVLTPANNATSEAADTLIGLAAAVNDNQAQQWKFERQSDGSYRIINRANTDMVLALQNNGTVSGTRVVLGEATAASASWQLEGGNIPLVSAPAPIVTFNANSGAVTATSAVTSGGRLESLPTPTKTNYTFNGWYTTAAQTGGTQITTSYNFTANTTVYARWTANSNAFYTVTFNPNNGSTAPLATTTTGTNYKLTSLPILIRGGYIFSGWYTENSGGTQVTTSTVFSQNMTVYGRWSLIGWTPSRPQPLPSQPQPLPNRLQPQPLQT